jgi:ABC-type Zn uptake system ZnuABC Zn-binding protein ZnuA
MADKRSNLRFTVQFTSGDPLHEHAAKILNAQGRRKAKYIADAIDFYEQNGNGAIPTERNMDVETVEKIVERILRERTPAPSERAPSTPADAQAHVITDALRAFRGA